MTADSNFLNKRHHLEEKGAVLQRFDSQFCAINPLKVKWELNVWPTHGQLKTESLIELGWPVVSGSLSQTCSWFFQFSQNA